MGPKELVVTVVVVVFLSILVVFTFGYKFGVDSLEPCPPRLIIEPPTNLCVETGVYTTPEDEQELVVWVCPKGERPQ